MALMDPDGRKVDNEYPGAIIFADSRPAYVIVKNPQPGRWKVYVDKPSGGRSPYDVIVSAAGQRHKTGQYQKALVLFAIGALVVAILCVATLRWPIRRSGPPDAV